jgi:hypothetical protein
LKSGREARGKVKALQTKLLFVRVWIELQKRAKTKTVSPEPVEPQATEGERRPSGVALRRWTYFDRLSTNGFIEDTAL